MTPWWRSEPAALAVIFAAVLASAAPWSVDWSKGFVLEDTAWTVLVMHHLQDVVLHGADWRTAPVGFPIADSVAQSDWVAAEALLALPWRLVGADAFVAHQHVVLLGLLATAWVGHRVAKALLGSGPHTWVAGVLVGAGPAALAHAGHVNLVHHETAFGGGLLLAVAAERRDWRLALGGGALIGLSPWFGFYVGLHAAVIAVVVAFGALFARRLTLPVAGAALAGALVPVLPLIPVLRVYAAFSERHQLAFQENFHAGESWDLATTLRPQEAWLHLPLHAIWPQLPPPSPLAFDPPNPGYVAVLLAAAGLVWLRSRWSWPWVALAALAALCLALALGPDVVWMTRPTGIPGPYRLLAALPGVASLRAPVRFFEVAFPALALFSAAGAKALLDRVGERGAPAVGALLVALVVLEAPASHAVPLREIAPDAVYEALIALPGDGPVYDELVVANRAQCRHRRSSALRAALDHGRPLLGGVYARPFPEIADVNRRASAWPAERAVAWLGKVGVGVVVDHPPLATPPPGASCTDVDGHRLCALPDTDG
jgi:hypothetical protein